ncbi:MAG TPA: LPS export ABC transporter periplasmic protein LptC [Rhizomicrobium sp.]|jgi:lipopolysaccharide export system protein LptC|nr:LPS export ABC transporter periplasmic protein LptC [Rhizomicrobium sp.]
MMAAEPKPERAAGPASGEGYDWSARIRTTALEAHRYSRFVVVMKKVLSLGAFLIIAAVLAFFFIARQPRPLQFSYETMGRVENDLAMIKPRLTGADDKGHPFVITADQAVQDAKNTKKATLTNIEADLALDAQNWLNARARTGMVDMSAGKLEMGGGISVFTDTGYELHTKAAAMDLKKSVVHGHDPVTGQGPDGTLRADRFHADRATNILTLSGNVRMTITGTSK